MGILVPPTRASGINVAVSQNSVTISMRLQLVENFTPFPLVQASLNSSDSRILLGLMNAAVQRLVPGSVITALTVVVGTKQLNPTLQFWQLHEDISFNIAGVETDLGGTVRTNLAFLSLNVSDPVKLAGAEINQVGSAYLVSALKRLPVTTTSQYFIDGSVFTSSVVPGNVTTRFRLLDFSWVPSVSQWTHQYSVFESSTWTLSPASPFNLTVGVRQIETQFVPLYTAVYSPSLTLTAPGAAWSDGTSVLFNIPSPADVVMFSIIVALLATGAVSYLLDRRLTRPLRFRRKK